MRRTTVLASAVGALALLVGAAAAAQTPLVLGRAVRGEIAADDPMSGEGEQAVNHDAFSLSLRAGQRIQALVESDAFDSVLALYRQGGEADEPLAFNDDHEEGSANARLRFTAPEEAAYVLHVRPLSGAGGDYALTVTERPALRPGPRPRDLGIGQEVRRELGRGDPADDEDRLYDAYRLRLSAGQRVQLDQSSDTFDAALSIGRMNAAGVFESLGSNDDGPDRTNARLIFATPEAGDYIVRASSFAEAAGDYLLIAAEGPPPAPNTPIALGGDVDAELTAEDPMDDHGHRHDAWRVTLAEDQRIEAVMSSNDFDAYLEIGTDGPAGFELIGEDDDGAGRGTDARVTLTAPAAGDYLILARSLSGTDAGDYELSVREIAPDPEPVALVAGSGVVQGEIGDDDATSEGGRRFDAYRLTATQDQRIRLVMRSGDFDTYLEIGSAEGEFSVLASDDDGLGEGTDSRLDFAVPEAGDYTVRASPLTSDADGLYSLELVERGPPPASGSIVVGGTVRGSLTEDSAINDVGAFYDDYAITLAEGQKLRLTLVSNAFDAVLYIVEAGDVDGASITPVASDDDGLSDTHSKIDFTVEDAGDYVLRAAALAPGQSGDYVLTVEPRE